MKRIYSVLSIVFALLIFTNTTLAQENQLTQKYKQQTIEKLGQLIEERYVFPEVAKKTSQHLIVQFKDGHFDAYKNDEEFAKALTESTRSINNDKHMKIWKNKPFQAPKNTPERKIEEKLDQRQRKRAYNIGFNNVKVLEGNVGYLDLRGFAGSYEGKPMADAYMKLIENTDAIIIDLSKNGGGDPDMVRYLCSFFFNKKVHLNSLYFREGDRTIEFWTEDKVGTKKLADIPLVVITSEKTFSGAEEFSYNMQTQKRATLIGQTTGGGANPGSSVPINDNLTVFIPNGKAINPITNTNWEGTGVTPDIVTEVDETLDRAIALAQAAAEKYRTEQKSKMTKIYLALLDEIEKYEEGQSDEKVLKHLKNCVTSGLLQEWEINIMGYDYLTTYNKPMIAQSIFYANTKLFPDSYNVFDSYAEALMANGKWDASIANYEKAVKMAKKADIPELEMYQENLAKAKRKMKEYQLKKNE